MFKCGISVLTQIFISQHSFASEKAASTKLISQDYYVHALETVNQQLSTVSEHFQTQFTILGVIVGLVACLIGLGAIFSSYLIYRQSNEYKTSINQIKDEFRKSTNEYLESQKEKVSLFIDENKRRIEENIKEYRLALTEYVNERKKDVDELKKELGASNTTEEKKQLKEEIRKLQSDIIKIQTQLTSSTITGPNILEGFSRATNDPLAAFPWGSANFGASGINSIETILATSLQHQCSACGNIFETPKGALTLFAKYTCPKCGSIS